MVKHLQFDLLCVFSIKTGTKRIIPLDELSNDALREIVRLDA